MSEKVQRNKNSQKLSTVANFGVNSDTHLGPDYTMAVTRGFEQFIFY